MKRKLGTTLVGLTLAIAFAGCGGSGTTDDVPNFYTGSWVGAWSGNAGLESGGLSLRVSTLGGLTGTMTGPVSLAPGGIINGTVERNGEFVALIDWPGPDDYTVTGTLTRVGDQITCNYSYTYRGGRFNGSSLLDLEVSAGT